jgi:cytoskeleton protein RodZ
VASAEPRQFGSENAVSRVTIKARIDSWVQIQDREGEKLLTRVLRAGDSYRVPDRPGLLMETGNAGGLEITVDGSVIPDIGPKGAVRREVALEAESLKAGGSR